MTLDVQDHAVVDGVGRYRDGLVDGAQTVGVILDFDDGLFAGGYRLFWP